MLAVVLVLPVFADGSLADKGCRTSFFVNSFNLCFLSPDKKAYCTGRNYQCSRGRHLDFLNGKPYVNFGELSNGVERKVFQIAGSQHIGLGCAIVEGEDASERVVTCWGSNGDYKVATGRGAYHGQCFRTETEDPETITWQGNCNSAGCDGEDPTKWISGDYNPKRKNIAYRPVKLPDNISPETLYVNGGRACVIGSDDKVYCWGGGGCCLGLDADAPDPDATHVGVAAHGLYGWDPENSFGNNFQTPEFPEGLHAVKLALTSYDTTCALFNDGTVRCWGSRNMRQTGSDSQGQVGCGGILMKDLLPVENIDFNSQVVVDIYAGKEHACALLDSGDLYCWGDNRHGQTGNFNGANNLPSKVDLGDKTVKMAALGYEHTCAIMSDDTVQCWGDNRLSRLGLDLGGYNAPLQKVYPPMTEQTINGILVNGPITLGKCPSDCATCRCWADDPDGNLVPASIAAGHWLTCVVFTDGSMQCWGTPDSSSEITNYVSTEGSFTPTKVKFDINDLDFTSIPCATTCAAFTECEHPSLLKVSEICEAGENSCNVNTCCKSKATCEGISDEYCQSDGEDFYTLTKGSDQECIGDSTTCDKQTCCKSDFCALTAWGEDLPFVEVGGNKITLEDKLDESSELHIKFTLATETCVDRTNWLGLTYHKLGTPVCTGGTDCSGKSEEECTDSCQFRIPCLEEELDASLSDAIFGEPHKTYEPERADVTSSDGSLKTNFVIKVKTDQLTTDGAGDIYTAPTGAENTGKLEFCVRPAVTADSSEILYREIVLRIHVGMGASFTVAGVDSDSFQEGAVQNVNSDVTVKAQGFACRDINSDGTYVQEETTLKPNEIFTLCVVPDSVAVQCKNFLTLDFAQVRGTESYSERRIGDNDPTKPVVKTLLTGVPTTADVVDSNTATFAGCVVKARLGADFFASTTPNEVSVSGSVLFDFKSASGRRLHEGPNSMAVFGKRSLQQSDQPVEKFEVQFQLSADEAPNNKPQVDAGVSIGGYCSATAFAAVAVSQMI